MKKLLYALLAFVIAVALCGCGTDSREQVDTNPPIETIEPTAPPCHPKLKPSPCNMVTRFWWKEHLLRMILAFPITA